MLGFVARWLSDAIRLGLSLAAALVFLQVPAVTHEYLAALRQVTGEARRDIDQREASARQFYHLAADSDEGFIAALRPVEPSNAEALAASVRRMQVLRAAYDRISAAPPLLRPVRAALDVLSGAAAETRPVLATTLDTYVPQVTLSGEAAIYGAVGLALGAFAAQLLLSLAAALGGRRRRLAA